MDCKKVKILFAWVLLLSGTLSAQHRLSLRKIYFSKPYLTQIDKWEEYKVLADKEEPSALASWFVAAYFHARYQHAFVFSDSASYYAQQATQYYAKAEGLRGKEFSRDKSIFKEVFPHFKAKKQVIAGIVAASLTLEELERTKESYKQAAERVLSREEACRKWIAPYRAADVLSFAEQYPDVLLQLKREGEELKKAVSAAESQLDGDFGWKPKAKRFLWRDDLAVPPLSTASFWQSEIRIMDYAQWVDSVNEKQQRFSALRGKCHDLLVSESFHCPHALKLAEGLLQLDKQSLLANLLRLRVGEECIQPKMMNEILGGMIIDKAQLERYGQSVNQRFGGERQMMHYIAMLRQRAAGVGSTHRHAPHSFAQGVKGGQLRATAKEQGAKLVYERKGKAVWEKQFPDAQLDSSSVLESGDALFVTLKGKTPMGFWVDRQSGKTLRFFKGEWMAIHQSFAHHGEVVAVAQSTAGVWGLLQISPQAIRGFVPIDDGESALVKSWRVGDWLYFFHNDADERCPDYAPSYQQCVNGKLAMINLDSLERKEICFSCEPNRYIRIDGVSKTTNGFELFGTELRLSHATQFELKPWRYSLD